MRFVGDLDRRERVGVYRAARAFVQTARRRVFAEELLWALVAGCVGIVEYHAGSSAHELVEHYLEPGGNRDRGFRTTSEQELAAAIREAASLETMREHFAEPHPDEQVTHPSLRDESID